MPVLIELCCLIIESLHALYILLLLVCWLTYTFAAAHLALASAERQVASCRAVSVRSAAQQRAPHRRSNKVSRLRMG